MNLEQIKKIELDFKKSSQKIIFLDYDGTLTPIVKHHSLAQPSQEVVKLLTKLSKLASTDLVIISGRNKESLQEWLPINNITLIAEHGAWIKKPNQNWQLTENITNKWKPVVIELLQKHTNKDDGTFIEEKDYSIGWHYMNIAPNLVIENVEILLKKLTALVSNTNLEILHGKKIIEIRNSNINKGKAALNFISQKNYDFILAAGDDLTDEEMFRALPSNSYTIKIGLSNSCAKYRLSNPQEMLNLLKSIA